MYVRFVIADRDEDSGKRQGVFQAVIDLKDSGELLDYEEEQLGELLDWFNANLKEPISLRRHANKFHTVPKAISWFKDGATQHLSRMRELISILEEHNIAVDMIQTEKPGYIVYEDPHQITAEAFKDTGA